MRPKWAAGVVAMAVPWGAAAEPWKVVVSLLPQAGVVERVGGERIQAMVLVDEGQDPHTYAPSAKEVTELSRAAIWFTSGMPFDQALAKKVGGRADGPKVISLGADALEGRLAGEEHEHHEEHAEGEESGKGKAETESQKEEKEREHEHHHDGDWDPHVWLSPLLVAQQAHLVSHALGELDPEHAAEFEARAEALEKELHSLHEELGTKLAPLKGSVFYVFHPAFGYFAQAYGMRQVAIETGGREPSAKHLSDLTGQARKDGVKVVLMQPQFQKRGAERVAQAIGAELREVNDLHRDVFVTMRTLAEVLVTAQARP